MKTTPNLSVIIIAKNEEKKLPQCLESVSWAGEIVLIDDFSTDATAKIGRSKKAKIFKPSKEIRNNYAGLRNFGLEKSSGEWVFYVDADERATPELRNEIDNIVNNKENTSFVFAIPRKNIILGKELKHGGWWPDYVKRLYKRDHMVKWVGDLHEEPIFKGTLAHLKEPLIHIKHDNLSDMVDKTNKWSEVEAKLMLDAKHPPMNVARFLSAMFREFRLRMINQKAYLDGTEGIVYAIYQIFSRFLSYGKLWEMQRRVKQ